VKKMSETAMARNGLKRSSFELKLILTSKLSISPKRTGPYKAGRKPVSSLCARKKKSTTCILLTRCRK
jgi:hypothetical protein